MLGNILQVMRHIRTYKMLLEGLVKGDVDKTYSALVRIAGDNVDKIMLYKVVQHAINVSNASSVDDAKEKLRNMLKDFGVPEEQVDDIVDDIIETGKFVTRVAKGELHKLLDIFEEADTHVAQVKPTTPPPKPVTKPVTERKTLYIPEEE